MWNFIYFEQLTLLTCMFQIYPRHMLFGHTAAITCIAPGSGQLESSYIVSASENGWANLKIWKNSDTKNNAVHI